MARDTFNVELGIGIWALDGESGPQILQGSSAPGGDADIQDAALQGSLFLRSNGDIYKKQTSGTGTDKWENLSVASSMELDSGYTAGAGDVAAADSVLDAIQKLDGNQDNVISILGIDAQTLSDLGIFTGTTITDNVSVKTALQELETALEAQEASGSSTGLTTLADVDTVLVDNFEWVEYEYVAFEEATPANRESGKISMFHDGTSAADATAVDSVIHGKLKHGSNFNLVFSADVNGAGGSQTMRLRASSSTGGVTIKWRRTGISV